MNDNTRLFEKYVTDDSGHIGSSVFQNIQTLPKLLRREEQKSETQPYSMQIRAGIFEVDLKDSEGNWLKNVAFPKREILSCSNGTFAVKSDQVVVVGSASRALMAMPLDEYEKTFPTLINVTPSLPREPKSFQEKVQNFANGAIRSAAVLMGKSVTVALDRDESPIVPLCNALKKDLDEKERGGR